MRLLASNGNTEMQNFIRKQHTNSRSFDMISLIVKYVEVLLAYQHFPIIYDTTRQCLLMLMEMIQGPNLENQAHIINCDFVNIAVRILRVN